MNWEDRKCHAGINPATPTSKNARPSISKRAMKSRGLPDKEAERRAWATVNKETGGGKKSGSGRGKPMDTSPSRKGGKIGGKAAASRPASARSASAKKAAATRKRNASR